MRTVSPGLTRATPWGILKSIQRALLTPVSVVSMSPRPNEVAYRLGINAESASEGSPKSEPTQLRIG